MDKKLFFMLLFVAATGLTTGSFFEIYLTGDGKDQLMDLLDGFFSAGSDGDADDSAGGNSASLTSFLATFWQSLRSGLFFLLFCYVSPLLIILLPLDVLFLFLRGLFLGFSAAMLLETFGLSGIGYILLTLVPSGLIQMLLFAFLTSLSLHEGMSLYSFRPGRSRGSSVCRNRKAPQILAGQYLNFYVAGLAVLILSCLLQAFLLQAAT